MNMLGGEAAGRGGLAPLHPHAAGAIRPVLHALR